MHEAPLRFIGKFISCPPDGKYIFRLLGILLDLLPDSPYMNHNCRGIPCRILSPDPLKQRFPGENTIP